MNKRFSQRDDGKRASVRRETFLIDCRPRLNNSLVGAPKALMPRTLCGCAAVSRHGYKYTEGREEAGPIAQHERIAVPPLVEVPPVVPVNEYKLLVMHCWTEHAPSRATTKNRPSTQRKMNLVKPQRLRSLETMSRAAFIEACLSVHELEDQFRASDIRGPAIKLWWNGSSGGKAGASTVEVDDEFVLLRDQIVEARRIGKDITVSASFDTDDMDAFRVRKRVRDGSEPRDMVGSARDKAQRTDDINLPLHGEFILMLKDTHSCEMHRGEHGEPGFCYIWPDGSHLGLNGRRLAAWAAGMAAGVATRYSPPNCPEFDGPQNRGLAAARPRGRAQPAVAPQAPPAPAPVPASPDLSTMLVAALVPLLTALTRQNGGAPAAAPVPAIPMAELKEDNQPLSPPSTPTSCIRDCLAAFKAAHDIDILRHEATLNHRDLSPDIITDVPHAHLAGVLAISEGKTLRFQRFCREWSARQNVKLSRQL